jgi:hypothetical protein
MTQYTVRLGDTLWAIAERCYGDGQLWSYLADHNPLAQAGVLYEGQCLDVPLPPIKAQSLADARRHALPLGHAPVKVRLDGSGPLCRFDGFGAFGLCGLVGELIFHRHGHVHLGELSVSRLVGYRLEQIAWAKGLFVKHFCTADLTHRSHLPPSTGPGPYVTPEPYHCRGPEYTIAGRVGVWWNTTIHKGIVDVPNNLRMSLTLDVSKLFDLATLVLGELPAPLEASSGKTVPLGRALRAACPLQISPAELWALTRDETSFLPTPSAPVRPATPEVGPAAPPAALPPGAPKPKKSGRKAGRKKHHVEKHSAKQAKSRTSRKRPTR